MKAVLSDDELFRRIRQLIAKGWIDIPSAEGYGGSGAPGKLLEAELGLDGGNLDIPDAGKWELKYHSGRTLLTLFHKEGRPRGHLYDLIQRFGWDRDQGLRNFRHTIQGSSDLGFMVQNEDGIIKVVNVRDEDAVQPYWTHDELLTAFASKLRRLALVEGERKAGRVRFLRAYGYQEPSPTRFIESISSGVVAIDFDARTTTGKGLRNHGTKFRISVDHLGELYESCQII